MPIHRRLPQLAPSLAALALALQAPAPWAQIASPINAGMNAGNNSAGSSTTPISTPSFNTPVVISTLSGTSGVAVSVGPSGSLVVTAPPAVVSSVSVAIASSAATTPLGSLVTAPAAASLTGPAAQATPVTLTTEGRTVTTTLLASADAVTALVAPERTISVVNPASGAGGSITITGAQIQIVVSGAGPAQSISVAATPATRDAVVQFASTALAAGATPEAINLGSSIVAAGATPLATAQLLGALQGLANQSSLTNLATGITTFNGIVAAASPTALTALAGNPAFQAARSILVGGRGGIPTAN